MTGKALSDLMVYGGVIPLAALSVVFHLSGMHWRHSPREWRLWLAGDIAYLAMCGMDIATGVVSGDTFYFAVGGSCGIWAVYMLWRTWKNRPRRKKRLAAMGAKSKAIIEGMRRKMAERPARPVLIPVPVRGGAW